MGRTKHGRDGRGRTGGWTSGERGQTRGGNRVGLEGNGIRLVGTRLDWGDGVGLGGNGIGLEGNGVGLQGNGVGLEGERGRTVWGTGSNWGERGQTGRERGQTGGEQGRIGWRTRSD